MKKQSITGLNSTTEQKDDYDDEEIDSASCVYSKEFEISLRKLDGIHQNDTFLELVQKQEITNVILVDTPNKEKNLKFVTTTNDGFIKMNEVNL